MQLRIHVLPKRPAAPDQIFPHTALRFVQAQGSAAAQERTFQRRADLVLVEAVTEFVHRAEERLVEKALVVARGDADVLGGAVAGERMDCGV